jgi:hypothetical protein
MNSNRDAKQMVADSTIISNITIIVARKTDYFNVIKNSSMVLDLPTYHSKRFLDCLGQAIARMDPRFFMTDEERKSKKLDKTTCLEDLDRETIFKEIKRSLESL